jgi:hypothetical protein
MHRFPDPAPEPLNLGRIKVRPLSQRRSLSTLQHVLVNPESPAPAVSPEIAAAIRQCAEKIRTAQTNKAAVILIYGAHLLRNGAALLLAEMMDRGWISHLATNGAGSIHDWEFSFLGKSTESVEDNVAKGCFGSWDETGCNLHLALLAGGIRGEGYGRALGRFILEDGADFPAADQLESELRENPVHPLTPARADLLISAKHHRLPAGRYSIEHPWKHASIFAQAFARGIPLTVHPGIGYDIISNHPMFNGAVIGRAADIDFRQFAASVERLDGGVVLSVGSAIMGPQVFEKSLSCVNNLRLQEGRAVVRGHAIYVVDIQDGGNWNWDSGEPPKSNPAYYLRFCKSYSRMGGIMRYCQCDNVAFVHNLFQVLRSMNEAAPT